jgi:hypothetical protein
VLASQSPLKDKLFFIAGHSPIEEIGGRDEPIANMKSHDAVGTAGCDDIVAQTLIPPDVIDVDGHSDSALTRRIQILAKRQSFAQAG